MDFNTIIPFILPITSGLALIISICSISYTYYQNKRKIEADLWFDHEESPRELWDYEYIPRITLCGFNPGYRSVALIQFKLLVNNEPLYISEGLHKVDPKKYERISSYIVLFQQNIDFPHILGEGEAVFLSIDAPVVANFLYYNNFRGVVQLSGYFETAQKKIVKSMSTIDFDIEKYRIK